MNHELTDDCPCDPTAVKVQPDGMLTRRVRFVYEAEVEYRAADPDYCPELARTEWANPGQDVRVLHPELVTAGYADVERCAHVHDADTAYDGTCANCPPAVGHFPSDIADLIRAAYRRGWDDGSQGEPFGANFIAAAPQEPKED